MLGKALTTAAAGNAAGEATYVEDVFSTYLYEGNGTFSPKTGTNTIVNGVDLDSEGGLVWVKSRGTSNSHFLYDTERGTSNFLSSNATSAENTSYSGYGVTSYNSNGFTLEGNVLGENGNGDDLVSWTFRKAPKFFDVVTYTGSSAPQTISHNLGSVPGCIIVKDTTAASDWYVYHRGIDATAPEDYRIYLNSTAARNDSTAGWYDTAPTDTEFTVGSGQDTTGNTYVAYLFAHNDGDGEFGENADQDIIKCGSYTGNSAANGPEIDLGFEPQWLLLKRATNTSAGSGWYIYDAMRGVVTGGADSFLKAESSGAESSTLNLVEFNATGFKLTDAGSSLNASGDTYIYIAIRRGPMKTPESGTEVFAIDSGGNGDSPAFVSNFPVDLGIRHPDRDQAGNGTYWSDRLRGNKYLKADSTAAELTITAGFDQMDGFEDYSALSDAVGWMFRRAPGFFDVVAYTGTGANRTVNHNLGVEPELIIFKKRSASGSNWTTYSRSLGATKYLQLNKTASEATFNHFQDTDPTNTQFYLTSAQSVNESANTFIAYLFATVPGVSKVGSYTGIGGNANGPQTIDCGFTTGARFVLIKATNAVGNWYLFDSERGIVTGNDPYLLLNDTAAESSADVIEPDASGFIAGSANLVNSNGEEYIFLAIA